MIYREAAFEKLVKKNAALAGKDLLPERGNV